MVVQSFVPLTQVWNSPSSATLPEKVPHELPCEGSIRHSPPGPHLRIRLIRGRFGIEIGSNVEIDIESMSNRC